MLSELTHSPSSTPQEAGQPQAEGGSLPAVGGQVPASAPGLVCSSTCTKQLLVFDPKYRQKQLRRAVTVAAFHLGEHLQQGGFRYRAAMITATYREDGEWEPRDISKLVDRYQQWGKARGFKVPLVWVAELTKAGRVHYHLILWLPRGETPPKPDAQGWWTKGMTNCVWARSPVGYLAKYASKGGDASQFPKGLRMHGRAGFPLAVRLRVVYALAPMWLKQFVPAEHGVERVSWEMSQGSGRSPSKRVSISGWWRDLVTHIEYKTPYTCKFIPGEGVLLERHAWTEDHLRFPA